MPSFRMERGARTDLHTGRCSTPWESTGWDQLISRRFLEHEVSYALSIPATTSTARIQVRSWSGNSQGMFHIVKPSTVEVIACPMHRTISTSA